MKIKLPANAKVSPTENGFNDSIIKMPGLMGWDIASAIAIENGVDLLSFVKFVDLGVYQDHVIIDIKHVA